MKAGFLSHYFKTVAMKRISAVETAKSSSNQHEFNGITKFKDIFGLDRRKIETKFLYLSDEDQPFSAEGEMSWCDSRENHPQRSEFRLYYPTNDVINAAAEGDLLLIGIFADLPERALVVIVKGSTTFENQLRYLFNYEVGKNSNFFINHLSTKSDIELSFPAKAILNELGIEIDESLDEYLGDMINNFGGSFPPTAIFSEYARKTLKEIDPVDAPDKTLIQCMEREESLFKTLETYIVERKLKNGFGNVEDFLSYSLTVQNRRKSRAGLAFENHIEEILKENDLRYSRGKKTEKNKKPDFIFPSIEDYRNNAFSARKLTMLAAKSTCKERWRQILPEADRIETKHIITIEPAISENQTDEMKDHNVQL